MMSLEKYRCFSIDIVMESENYAPFMNVTLLGLYFM